MRSDWKKTTIDEACARVYSGGTPSTKEPAYWNGDMNWLSSGETHNKFIYETERKITKLGVEQSSTQLAFKDSIVIATAGQGYTRGQASFLKIDTYVNQSILVLEADRTMVEPLFLYYNLSNRYEELRQLSDGTSTRGGLSGWIVRRMAINLPPIDIQKKIVDVLYAIDQKIECNIAINKNLEEQLTALYEDLISSSRCIMSTVGDIAEKIAMGPFGSNIKVSTFVNQGIPIISGNHLRGLFLEEHSFNYITEAHAEKLGNSIVYPNDIIFTHAGNIGTVAMIPPDCNYEYYIISQRQFYLRCDENKVVPEYVLLYFHSRKGQQKLLSYANQTAVPSIAQPATNLKKITIPLPTYTTQKKWQRTTEPLVSLYLKNRCENMRLCSIRDTLLPRLMSGELDVSNIEL